MNHDMLLYDEVASLKRGRILYTAFLEDICKLKYADSLYFPFFWHLLLVWVWFRRLLRLRKSAVRG